MSKNCRVLKSGKCEITQLYNSQFHKGIDLVKERYQLDEIVAHSDGIIVQVIDSCATNTPMDKSNPGNMIKIDHGNGFCTRYLHLAPNSVKLARGDKVVKGQTLGMMGDTGYSFGAHLHFEILKNGIQVNPIDYLDADFLKFENSQTLKYKIGDVVQINGVYVSSISSSRLIPTVKTGVITKILADAPNPYLLNNGQIGWINDNCIINEKPVYYPRCNYNGVSIVDGLKEIGVDSSFDNRLKIAKSNEISNYQGTAEENIKLLNLLKNGKLKK